MTGSSWKTKVLGCPRCGNALAGWGARATVLRCRGCGPYPVLGGVPVLVPDAATWCASYFDASLAALAEHDLVSRADVETLEAFAAAAPEREPSRFSDDWTGWEARGEPAPAPVPGPGAEALGELLHVADVASPTDWLLHRAPGGVVLEVGCGAGLTSSRLRRKDRRVLVGDLSLRAVLTAAQRSGAEPVVLDAHALPVQPRRLDAVLAENVVDLLDDADSFFTSAHLGLRAGGRVLLSTPAPALGSPDGDEGMLDDAAVSAGFEVEASVDGLPWLRRNSSRFLEVWLVRAVALRR